MAVALLDLGSLEPGRGAGALGQGCASQQAQALQAPRPCLQLLSRLGM